jgi:hypothetical protein
LSTAERGREPDLGCDGAFSPKVAKTLLEDLIDRAFESRGTGLPAVPVSDHVPIVESEEALANEPIAAGLVVGFLVSA